MTKRAIHTQLFKKICKRCPKTYRPAGKYNKLCPSCMTKMMEDRHKKIKEIAKNRKLRIDSPKRFL